MAQVRVALPYHLKNLARIDGELRLEVSGAVTVKSILDEVEARYPGLRGTLREHDTLKRRPFIRFYACREDYSLVPPETPLPDAVARGEEPLLVVGAMAGG